MKAFVVRVAASLFVAGSLLLGCNTERKRAEPPAAGFQFADVTGPAGLTARHDNGGERPLSTLDTTGGGVAWLDYDRDGEVDLFVVGGRGRDVLYRNRGDGTFEDVTKSAGIRSTGYSMGVVVGDYDGDGYPDLYITRHGVNQLYRNTGHSGFEDATTAAGVGGVPVRGLPKWSLSGAWFDAESDGDLDLYVTNYCGVEQRRGDHCTFDSVQSACPPSHYPAQQDTFYENVGRGRFRDATREFGFVESELGRGMAALPFHATIGEPPVLFVANDTSPNFLFVRGKDGRKYEERANPSGVSVDGQGQSMSSMGVDTGDIDGDGRLDLFVGTYQFALKSLFKNSGDLSFLDISERIGLRTTSWDVLTFGVGLVDFDLDSDLDLFLANGHVQDNIDAIQPSVAYKQRAQLLANDGGSFRDVSAEAGAPFRDSLAARGAAFADFDNDGDVDVAVSENGGPVRLWRNDGVRAGRRWLQVRLEGASPNTEALGALVELTVNGKKLSADVHSGRGYCSESERRLTFGLGENSNVEQVSVRWPDGKVTTVPDPAVDQLHVIRR